MSSKTQYYLDKLQEEAAEVIQAVSKIRRFGSDNHHPERAITNKEDLVNEIEDLLALIAALEHSNYIDLTDSKPNIVNKLKSLL